MSTYAGGPCGIGLLVGSGADAWLMMWASDTESGPRHADGLRAAGLSTSDEYLALSFFADGTYEVLSLRDDEISQARLDMRRLRPALQERDDSDLDGLWDFTGLPG